MRLVRQGLAITALNDATDPAVVARLIRVFELGGRRTATARVRAASDTGEPDAPSGVAGTAGEGAEQWFSGGAAVFVS